MGNARGFLQHGRAPQPYRPVHLRVLDWREVQQDFPEPQLRQQAERCMDCGVPFCHQACPVGNSIPDWNDLVYRGRWEQAARRLLSTNSFPEFTGLVCPAPCEAGCVLAMRNEPVHIKAVEWTIIERAFEQGWVGPRTIVSRTGKRVAVIGSGPSGLAAAQELNRAGHEVVVFEKNEQPGGLLRLGIPDFKLEKWIVERRVNLMQAEGVQFRTGVHVGKSVSAQALVREFDAVLLAGGSEQPRDLVCEGRQLGGVHFAMDFLTQQNRVNAGQVVPEAQRIVATGKHVVVLGGGDTGSDCVGTALRQAAARVTSLELLERPPDQRGPNNPWPQWPLVFRSSSSHEEGGQRDFGVLTKRLTGHNGQVQSLHAVRVRLSVPDASGRRTLVEVPGTDMELRAELVLLAMGFVHPVHDGLLQELGVQCDQRGNVAADAAAGFATSVDKVFAAGDMRRGQSLVVWAIWEGRQAARSIDAYLMGTPRLLSRDAYY